MHLKLENTSADDDFGFSSDFSWFRLMGAGLVTKYIERVERTATTIIKSLLGDRLAWQYFLQNWSVKHKPGALGLNQF